jgi:transcriptional regulator with XRE-family HTH domain
VAEVAGVRDRLGLTQEELARVIGYSTRSVAAWQSGRQQVSAPARLKLTEADRLAAALAQIMPSRKVGQWLRTPNPAFEGQRPMHVLERGEADRLWRMIHQIDANVAN